MTRNTDVSHIQPYIYVDRGYIYLYRRSIFWHILKQPFCIEREKSWKLCISTKCLTGLHGKTYAYVYVRKYMKDSVEMFWFFVLKRQHSKLSPYIFFSIHSFLFFSFLFTSPGDFFFGGNADVSHSLST